ncbi:MULTISPECIES: hypothetical protein [unclassified Streptomyces]|uniref:hypothetical protein n=1 Tax=unclassified Streptomyces TaxID=2593676 RepID=UPI002E1008AD|nr:hypothetical protein OG457_11415 [Streptomyces sp. NBC_01207]WTA17660.1 hypothetical protein OG365_06110 [Streptomyces sp. NBC_00853]
MHAIRNFECEARISHFDAALYPHPTPARNGDYRKLPAPSRGGTKSTVTEITPRPDLPDFHQIFTDRGPEFILPDGMATIATVPLVDKPAAPRTMRHYKVDR